MFPNRFPRQRIHFSGKKIWEHLFHWQNTHVENQITVRTIERIRNLIYLQSPCLACIEHVSVFDMCRCFQAGLPEQVGIISKCLFKPFGQPQDMFIFGNHLFSRLDRFCILRLPFNFATHFQLPKLGHEWMEPGNRFFDTEFHQCTKRPGGDPRHFLNSRAEIIRVSEEVNVAIGNNILDLHLAIFWAGATRKLLSTKHRNVFCCGVRIGNWKKLCHLAAVVIHFTQYSSLTNPENSLTGRIASLFPPTSI